MELNVLYNGVGPKIARKVADEATAFFKNKIHFNGFKNVDLPKELGWYISQKEGYSGEELLLALSENQLLIIDSKLLGKVQACHYIIFTEINGIAEMNGKSSAVVSSCKANPVNITNHEICHILGIHTDYSNKNCLMNKAVEASILCDDCQQELDEKLEAVN